MDLERGAVNWDRFENALYRRLQQQEAGQEGGAGDEGEAVDGAGAGTAQGGEEEGPGPSPFAGLLEAASDLSAVYYQRWVVPGRMAAPRRAVCQGGSPPPPLPFHASACCLLLLCCTAHPRSQCLPVAVQVAVLYCGVPRYATPCCAVCAAVCCGVLCGVWWLVGAGGTARRLTSQ